MLRPQLMGLFLTLTGSGCSTFTPSTLLYWETLQAPAEDPDFDQLHQSKFDREAKQLSQEGLKAVCRFSCCWWTARSKRMAAA